MQNRGPRRFSHSSHRRNHRPRRNGIGHERGASGSFSNHRPRNNFQSNQNAEKLVEKYQNLAKEAQTSGDKILSENYLQHADHFKRIINERNLNQPTKKIEVNTEIKSPQLNSTPNNQEQNLQEKKD